MEQYDTCRCCGSLWMEPVLRTSTPTRGSVDVGQCRSCHLTQALEPTDVSREDGDAIGAMTAPLPGSDSALTDSPALNAAFGALRGSLDTESMRTVEVPYVIDVVATDGWTTLPPGWQQCFSLTSLTRALANSGMRVAMAERNREAGTLRAWVVRDDSFVLTSEHTIWMLEQEWALGVRSPDFLRSGKERAAQFPVRLTPSGSYKSAA